MVKRYNLSTEVQVVEKGSDYRYTCGSSS